MTNEPIINARFKKFRDNYGLNNIADGEAFEQFVNSGILTQHQPDAFSADSELLEKICVGGPEDTGIDGAAVKVNGLLIKSIDEVDDIIQKYRRINIEFIFIQSKYKPNFDAAELNSFIAGVRNFLSNSPTLPMNEKIKETIKIKEYLLSDEITFNWNNPPTVRMYYVAMGKWRNNQHHMALVEQAKNDILTLKTYDKVDVHFIDSDSFRSILDSNENNFTAIIETIGSMELTFVDKVDNSCITLCSAEEFSKILTTEEGVIRKSLFDDNVRDYQGENTVNNEIFETIQDEPQKFILLNNGITIVCEEFTSNNRKLKIINPQIVNGCQTSHVIFLAKQKGLNISNVPLNVKIIATKDSDISNEIVKGTNRQTIVLDEAFEGTKKFHKDLEAFCNHYIAEFTDKIYYERRAKQYAHNPTIKQVQRINLRILTQYFVGMFLNKPHLSHRHESFLLREFSNIIFQETQSKLPYFTTAYSFYKLEKLFREERYFPELRAYKSQLLMLFRQAIAGNCPNLNSEKPVDEHSLKIITVLKDDKLTRQKFYEVGTIFKTAASIWIDQLNKSKFAMKDVPDFTQLLLKEVRKKFTVQQDTILNDENFFYKGPVIRTMLDRYGNYCGFIKRYPNNIFFHSNQNKNLDFKNIKGKFVAYKVSTSPKNNMPLAIEVNLEK
ncbi:AIPR family protein [Chitinophaga sp.]|uniref:AIPR family protein n=1 Tax=Chitinophaga sp. TaxID=1869181 RepID=UPI0031D5C72E